MAIPPSGRVPGLFAALLRACRLAWPLPCSGLFFYDRAITGNGWTTPYSLYTESTLPVTLWIQQCRTWRTAPGAAGHRELRQMGRESDPRAGGDEMSARGCTASWKWTLGIVPLTLALAGGLVLWRRLPRGSLVDSRQASSLCTPCTFPYWFVGMEDHHYVFESGPLWAVWTAVVSVSRRCGPGSRRPGRIGVLVGRDARGGGR